MMNDTHLLSIIGALAGAGVPIETPYRPRYESNLDPLYPDQQTMIAAHLRAAEAKLARAGTAGARRKAQRTVDALRVRLEAIISTSEAA